MTAKPRRIHVVAALLLAMVVSVSWALAEFAPVLHERFDPDPKEDVALGVRVTAAGLPAALPGQSGPVPLPNPRRPVDRGEPAYKERQSANANRYRIDRETVDPGPLTYHEPFRPSIAPFKRTHVFDSVNAEFDLAVVDPRLRPVTVGGVPSALEDQFYADLVLDLSPKEMIRVPSVGSKMAIRSAHLEPESPFGFYIDRAENWFIRAPDGQGKARLVMHVSVPRPVFDGRIEATSYSALVSELPPIPANVERVATQLLQRLGVSRVLAPAEALVRLVTYFRSFAESKDLPSATGGEALYRELVMSRKGVCRHRAYAFVVTALGLGIPARFVHNEAHAWVEVYGGTYWHRIDLGGAAPGIEYRGERPEGPPHAAPPESYPWPSQSRAAAQSLSAEGQVPANAEGQGSNGAPSSHSEADAGATFGQSAQSNQAMPAPSSGPGSPATPPAVAPVASHGHGRVKVSLSSPADVQRGSELGLSGRIESDEGRCSRVRVDVSFVQRTRRFVGGSAMTDENGSFSAKVTVPADIPVGKYDLVVSTPGSPSCPPASTE